MITKRSVKIEKPVVESEFPEDVVLTAFHEGMEMLGLSHREVFDSFFTFRFDEDASTGTVAATVTVADKR